MFCQARAALRAQRCANWRSTWLSPIGARDHRRSALCALDQERTSNGAAARNALKALLGRVEPTMRKLRGRGGAIRVASAAVRGGLTGIGDDRATTRRVVFSAQEAVRAFGIRQAVRRTHAAADGFGAFTELIRLALGVFDAAVAAVVADLTDAAPTMGLGGAIRVGRARGVRVGIGDWVGAWHFRGTRRHGLPVLEAIALDEAVAQILGVLAGILSGARTSRASASLAAASLAAASLAASALRTRAGARAALPASTLATATLPSTGGARLGATGFAPASDLSRTQCREERGAEEVEARAKLHHLQGSSARASAVVELLEVVALGEICEQPRVCRLPTQQLTCARARGQVVELR